MNFLHRANINTHSRSSVKTFRKRLASIWAKIPRPYFALQSLVKNYDSPWKKPADILYLGDSVLERTSSNDTDKRTVDQMTASGLSNEKRLLCISRPAYHLKVYYHLLSVLQHMRNRPCLVILPINIRSFSPQWDLNPAWQFDEEIEVMNAYAQTRKIPALRGNLDMLTFSEAERNLEFDFPFTDLKRIGQFVDLINNIPSDPDGKFYRRKQIYILHYLKTLVPDHRRLLYLGKTLGLLQNLRIKVLVYITPINYQGGIRHVGDGFVDLIRSNVDVVNNFMSPYFENGLVRFMDLQEYLSSDYFFHADELTEHLNQFGRAKLAQTLVNEIENWWN